MIKVTWRERLEFNIDIYCTPLKCFELFFLLSVSDG